MPEYLNLRQLSAERGCSPVTIYKAEYRGQLKVVAIGGLKLVTRQEADRYLRTPKRTRGRPAAI